MQIVCIGCGEKFLPNKSDQKYCSLNCGQRYRAKKWRADPRNPKNQTIKCHKCHKDFLPTNKNQIFCTKYCVEKNYRDTGRTKKEKKCLICNLPFKTKKGKTCSDSCRVKLIAKTKLETFRKSLAKGEFSEAEYIEVNEQVYRWNGKYFIRGSGCLHRDVWIKENGPIPKYAQIRHKDGNTRNNAIDNLEMITPSREGPLEYTVFNGDKYRWDGKYYFPCKGTKTGKRLHVAVWEYHNGHVVPEGCEIHHRDHNRRNNNIENLECLTIIEHRKHHANDKPTKRVLKHLDKIRPKAAAWHRSPEGRKWHSEHAARQIKNRDPHIRTCQDCNKEFLTKTFKAKYCSNNCKARGRRRELRGNQGAHR